MGTSFTLFRIAGTELKIHWSFALILVWGAVVFGIGASSILTGMLYGMLVIVLLFVCVTLHEFGHAIAAKRYQIKVPSIVLLPIGGVANLERAPDKPKQELVIAIAGPAVNVLIVAVLAPIALISSQLEGAQSFNLLALNEMLGRVNSPGVTNLLVYLIGINIMLALFNLLPAFPMDGGRVLRALLALTMPYVRATRIAVMVGRLLAIPLAIWGIMQGNILLLLVAFFVYVGGGAEREAVESKSVLRTVRAGSAVNPDAARLYTSERISRAVELIMTSSQTDYPVFDLSNRFVGVLVRPRLVEALRNQGPDTRVPDVMTPASEIPVVSPEMTLADVWEQMAQRGSRVAVVQDGAEFRGIINLDDIAEVFQVVGASLERTQRTQLPTANSQQA